MSAEDVAAFVASFDTVMTDCDGVLWNSAGAIKGSPDVVNKFREMGKRVFFCTNNSTKTRSEYIEKCRELGYGETKKEEVVGTSYLAAMYLKNMNFKGKVYVIGTNALCQELEEVGIQHTGVGLDDQMAEDFGFHKTDEVAASLDPDITGVIVGFDMKINYLKMSKASIVVSRAGDDAVFVATNTDEQFPVRPGVFMPGTGAIVSAVATAAGRDPVVMGKPHPAMFEEVRKSHPGIDPKRTLMIGDRANTDILLGKNCGLQTLMVGTGVNSLNDIRKWEKSEKTEERRMAADFYVDRLGDLLKIADWQ